MRERKYELLLAAIIAARATSFIFSKMVLADMDIFNLLAIRFLLAFILLAVIFCKRLWCIGKNELVSGAIVGLLFFLVMSSELTALRTTDSSTVALLENCSIIFVPLFETVLLRSFPNPKTVFCACVAMIGVFCLTAQVGTLTVGILFGLLAAALYAVAIIATDRVSHRHTDTLCIGIIQIGVMGILSLLASCFCETFHWPLGNSQWFYILMLVIVCTGFGFTLQPVAQSHVSSERAGLFCAISPAIATLLGIIVLHEPFGVLSIVGLILILVSIVFPYIKLS